MFNRTIENLQSMSSLIITVEMLFKFKESFRGKDLINLCNEITELIEVRTQQIIIQYRD